MAHLVGPPIMKSAGHCSAKFSGLFGGSKFAVDSTGPATKAHKMVKKMSHQLGTTNLGTPNGPLTKSVPGSVVHLGSQFGGLFGSPNGHHVCGAFGVTRFVVPLVVQIWLSIM